MFTSSDRGRAWAVENTGFATAVTEWLAINQGGGTLDPDATITVEWTPQRLVWIALALSALGVVMAEPGDAFESVTVKASSPSKTRPFPGFRSRAGDFVCRGFLQKLHHR